MWNGGISYKGTKIMVLDKEHLRAGKCSYVYRSHLVVEKVLGSHLPIKAEIHHFDNDPSNDEKTNLIVCEGRAYHMLLHQRERAYKATGNANWRKCIRCKKYDDTQNIKKRKYDGMFYHQKCETKYNRKIYLRNKNGTDKM